MRKVVKYGRREPGSMEMAIETLKNKVSFFSENISEETFRWEKVFCGRKHYCRKWSWVTVFTTGAKLVLYNHH